MADTFQIDKYSLYEIIGRGGFGTIYRAEDTSLHVARAVKILHPALNADPVFIERFRQEARTAARLDHPYIVPVYDLGQYEGAFYLVMRLMEGGSLKDLLEREGRLPPDRAITLLFQISAGLDFAHHLPERLVHRDIKPGNILLEKDGTARISDFGFSKALEGASSVSLSATGGMVGTPPYMAPELWRGQDVGPATDIYSLACMFYEMLTGRMLFTGNSPAQVMTRHVLDGPDFDASWPADVSAALRPILERSLAADPAERYPSATAFSEAVRDAVERPAADRKALSPEVPERREPEEKPATPRPAPAEPSAEEPPVNRQTAASSKKTPEAVKKSTASPKEKPSAEGQFTSTPPQPTPDSPTSRTPAPSQQSSPEPVERTPFLRTTRGRLILGAGGLFVLIACCGLIFGPRIYDALFSQPDVITTRSPAEEESQIGTAKAPIRILLPSAWHSGSVLDNASLLADALKEETGYEYEIIETPSYLNQILEMCDFNERSIGFLPGSSYVIAEETCGADVSFANIRYGDLFTRSGFFVRRDSGITSLADLEGASWAHAEPSSFTGYASAYTILNQAGISPGGEVVTQGHTDAMAALVHGEVDFATSFYHPFAFGDVEIEWSALTPDVPAEFIPYCGPDPANDVIVCGKNGEYQVLDARTILIEIVPDIVQQVAVIEISPGAPNEAIAFSDRFPLAIRAEIEAALQEIAATESWMKALSFDYYISEGIQPAGSEMYDFYREVNSVLGINLENIDDR